ncbi:MAG TPA: hypothetical protein VEV41_18285 [Terriglobales bacterium]|nr:hypothetical protein [Terriglobales bacterium]
MILVACGGAGGGDTTAGRGGYNGTCDYWGSTQPGSAVGPFIRTGGTGVLAAAAMPPEAAVERVDRMVGVVLVQVQTAQAAQATTESRQPRPTALNGRLARRLMVQAAVMALQPPAWVAQVERTARVEEVVEAAATLVAQANQALLLLPMPLLQDRVPPGLP